jgi:hypothetical protein
MDEAGVSALLLENTLASAGHRSVLIRNKMDDQLSLLKIASRLRGRKVDSDLALHGGMASGSCNDSSRARSAVDRDRRC